MRQVVLVNENDEEIGLEEIVKAHKEGLLHRAFSIYIFSKDRKRLLIQKRAEGKMLWPLHWANSCCSHPYPGEKTIDAAHRRLPEECGFKAPLTQVAQFVYRAEDPEGRGIEHEHLSLFFGEYEGEMNPNPEEIAEAKWISVQDLQQALKDDPLTYSPWLHLGLPAVLTNLPA